MKQPLVHSIHLKSLNVQVPGQLRHQQTQQQSRNYRSEIKSGVDEPQFQIQCGRSTYQQRAANF